MDGNLSSQFRVMSDQGAIPELGLRPCVGEHERTVRLLNDFDDLRCKPNPKMARPWEPLDVIRNDGFDLDLFLKFSTNQPAVMIVVPTQHIQRFF